MGEKGKVWTTTLLSRTGQSPAHPTNKVLILFVEVRVKMLVELGRKYRWQRPKQCPKCGGVRVWGHGYVEAYFDEAGSQGVYLKRYRCPECGVVIRLRPSGYWRKIQATVATVRQWVMDRLEKGRWPPGSNPARGRHWLRALRRQVRARLGMSYAERIAEGFLELVNRGVCAVSRAV
jgi:predicted RNA-binding Zn-ribbon protein involved in translation (DUF1610 family)